MEGCAFKLDILSADWNRDDSAGNREASERVGGSENEAQFDGGSIGSAVGDRWIIRGSHRNQVAYPHEGRSRLRKRSGGVTHKLGERKMML